MNELCVPPNWQAFGMTLNFNPWLVNVCWPASRKKKTCALAALTDNKSDTFVKGGSGRKSHKIFVRCFAFLLFLDGMFLNVSHFSQVGVKQATADTWCYLEKNLELGILVNKCFNMQLHNIPFAILTSWSSKISFSSPVKF